ncbi:hypothetical protein JTE90_006227 [Oedothorax gibbosus]|uniref:Uncharacterized protein n=1 Tax=Oedothorax gibbosus TaxID=931172 RepID=A0AAV6VV56_9ARAC|nr:hypothetical protein JTE90_006227 [Oedothorax gibbosus]
MIFTSSIVLSIFICASQLLQSNGQLSVDPEVRAQLEARVMSSMSLRELEEMVEKDERVVNIPKKFILIPKASSPDGRYGPEEMDGKAYIIHEKPKKYPKKFVSERMSYGLAADADNGFHKRSSYEPRSYFKPSYKFESSFKFDEEIPALFGIADMQSAASSPVKNFYESLVQKMMGNSQLEFAKDPLAILEAAASEGVPSYKPRFDYDSYKKDSTETKLNGKKYWKDAPERRDETVDENGCRTVVKKIMDPEDDKKSSDGKAKSVIITKECEYPNVDGPDAKVSEIQSESLSLDSDASEYDSPTYKSSRPSELDMEPAKALDPVAPDYIDTMLDTHFRSFPGFNNPITSFKGYQDRFKIRSPIGFKDIKPTVNVRSYEYTHPQSGFENGRESSASNVRNESPTAYERQYHFDRPEEKNRNSEADYSSSKVAAPKVHEHHYHYDYPEKKSRKSDFDEEKDRQGEDKYTEKKDPKMIKKSFAYYRKDNPKEDPNDHQYAEEFAQGNYRSFSSDYDSERDGPQKKA